MKKTTGILTAVAVGVVAYVGSTWFIGKQVQETIEQRAAEGNARMAQLFASSSTGQRAMVSIVDYKRGVFSSDAVYSLQITDDAGDALEFRLEDHIQHGPLPFTAFAAGKFSPALASSKTQLLPTPTTQAWFDATDGQTPMKGRTHIKFGGQVVSDWSLQSFSRKDENTALVFSGGEISVQTDNDRSNHLVNLAFPLVDFSAGGDRLVLKDLKAQYLGWEESENAHSDSTGTAADITLSRDGQEAFSLHDVSIQSGVEHRADEVSGYARYNIKQIFAGGTDWGNLAMGLAVEGFSANGVAQLVQVINTLSARHGSSVSAWRLSPDETAQLHKAYLAALTADSTLTLDPANWKNPQGETGLLMRINLVDPRTALAEPGVVSLVDTVDAVDAQVRVDKAMLIHALTGPAATQQLNAQEMVAVVDMLFDQYAQRLQRLGLAQEGNGVLTTSIAYAKGRVNANGEEMSLPEFMQRVLMAFLM